MELALKSCGLGLYHRIVGGSGMATIDQHFALPPFCESLGQHGHTQIISQNTPRIFAYSFTMVVYIYFSCFRAKGVQAIFDLVLLLPFLSDVKLLSLFTDVKLPHCQDSSCCDFLILVLLLFLKVFFSYI